MVNYTSNQREGFPLIREFVELDKENDMPHTMAQENPESITSSCSARQST